MNKIICLTTLLLLYTAHSLAGELYSPATDLSAQGAQLSAELRFDTSQTGDAYIAVQVAGGLYFLGPQGLSTRLEPFLGEGHHLGNFSLFNFPTDALPTGEYILYHVITNHGENPLDAANWLDGLHTLTFRVGLDTPAPLPITGGMICPPMDAAASMAPAK